MTSGRKTLAKPEIIEPALDQPRIDNAMAVMRTNAVQEQQQAMSGVFALGQSVGAAMMANMMKNFSAAAEIRAFEQINQSKEFKSLSINMPDGTFRPAESIDEFCRVVFGRGYKAMSDQKVMYERLGEESYENANRLGLKRSQLRLLLSLPEDERAAVDEAMRSESKAEVVSLIESLANKLDESRAEVEELKGELKATEGISSEKTQRIEKLLKEQHRIQAALPDEVLAALHKEATAIHNDIRGAIAGQLRQALIALNNHSEERGDAASTVFMAGLVGQLTADLTALRAEFGLPDVDRGELGWVDEA
ncbi:MAG: hypothetical protein AzoDbin1_04102 [Azoarcus sp.]|nr:hypothetical protein [Azoarcus sp.]